LNRSTIITCEHAGHEVPEQYEKNFRAQSEILQSHRGWDAGAFQVAEFFSEYLSAPLYATHTTRLLVEANRSLDNPQLFSEFTKALPKADLKEILEQYYFPYRNAVEEDITVMNKPVIHLSFHSFTPVLHSIERQVDVGLLFDPARNLENHICEAWFRNLCMALPDKMIKLNEPYQGTDDGFTTYLRKRFPDDMYAGIEIEINQKFVNSKAFGEIQHALLECLPF
jgi:predicted N-formylglutamate amidohydrolase